MDETYLAERQQRASEYFLEDERLTSDLTDDQARALLDWASYQASLAAGDPARSDEEMELMLRRIRSAVRYVARTLSDEHDPAALVALAQQALQADDNQEI